MRKITAAEFITLDGVVEVSEEWQPPYVSEDVGEAIRSSILNSEAALLGRVTYGMLAAYWPTQTHNEFGIADKLNSQPKYVVSSTLEKAEWTHSVLIRGDAVEQIRKLKQQPGGDIRLTGSPSLARSLMQAGLIDEYWLLVHPLIRGHGKRFFQDGMEPMTLQLVETRAFHSGVILLRYRPGKP